MYIMYITEYIMYEDVGEEKHHLCLKNKKWAFDQKH